MSNQLPAVLQDLVTTLVAAEQASPDTGGDFQYLKMDKGGKWLFGAEDTQVSADSAFVIEPASYSQGYVAWADGELQGEFMAVAGKTPITLGDLPPLKITIDDEGNAVNWKPQKAFAMKGIEGEEEGTQMLYKTSSRGGLKTISGLLSAIIERGRAGNSDLCPVIMLDHSSYKHKKKSYGTIYTPVLTVDEWMGMPVADDEPEQEEVEPAKVEKPKRSRKAAAMVEEEEVEEIVEKEEVETPPAAATRTRTRRPRASS